MTEFHILADDSVWRAGWEQRISARHAGAGLPEASRERRVAWSRGFRDRGELHTVAAVHADGAAVGFVAVAMNGGNARIDDIWIDPEHRGAGHGRAAREWAESWAREQGADRVFVQVMEPTRLFDDYPLRAQTMAKALGAAPELPAGVLGRPMTAAEYPAWLENDIIGYMADIVDSGSMAPEAARRKADEDFASLLPEGLDTPDNTLWTIEAGGAGVAFIWLKHHTSDAQSFVYSVSVSPDHRGKGHGRSAMLLGERATLEAGDEALLLNVFGHNRVAINLYDSLGYVVLDQSRSTDGTSSTS
ncbi:GNAT family N-acetyltransferase [Longispora sp. K20-0274]|uniref:GNAT family N-acetyltransferase n=1 Tax=Longispora sp. K20-0274 TaxID=3088255 RepID=UPI003999CCB5